MTARSTILFTLSLVTVALSLSLFFELPRAQAAAHPQHRHLDWFNEEDLQLGFRVGPQISGYTTYEEMGHTTFVQSSLRYTLGGVLKFIYRLPKIEADLLLNTRGGLNTRETLYAVSVPIVATLPVRVGHRVELELGGGVQPDVLLFGSVPHRSLLWSWMGVIGISADLSDYVFELQGRSIYGFDSVSNQIAGASPRDLQILLGALWRF